MIKIMLRVKFAFLIFHQFGALESRNLSRFQIDSQPLSNPMRDFLRYLLVQNSYVKEGLYYVQANKIDPEFSDYVLKTFSQNNGSVIILNEKIYTGYVAKFDRGSFILIATNPNEEVRQIFGSVGNGLRRDYSCRSKVALIFTADPFIPIIKDVALDVMSKIGCLKTLAAYETQFGIQVYNYDPFKRIKKVRNVTLTKFTKNLFKDKTRNLRGTKIKALLTYEDRTKACRNKVGEYKGKDYNTIKTIFDNLNAQLEIVKVDNISDNPWLEFQSGKSDKNMINKSMRKILDEMKIELLLKSETFTVERHSDTVLENASPHSQNDLVALVPASSLRSMISLLYEILSWKSKILLAVAPIVLTLVILLIRKISGESPDFLNVFALIIRLSVGSPARIRMQSAQSVLLIFWVFHCFFLDLAIQTRITSYFTLKIHEPEMDTIGQLLTSGMKFEIMPNYLEEMKKQYSSTDRKVIIDLIKPIQLSENAEKYELLTSLESDMGFFESIFKRGHGIILENDWAKFLVKHLNYLDRDGTPKYHLVRESVMPSLQSFKVVAGSPLLHIFDKKLRILNEAGFIELWAERDLHQAIIEGDLAAEDFAKDVREPEPLNMELLKFCFYFLSGTYAIATVVFLIESMMIPK